MSGVQSGVIRLIHRKPQYIALILTAITGAIHLGLGVIRWPGPLAISFLLAGFGFFGAILLYFLNYRRRLLYAIGIPYTGSQILLWIVLVRPTGVEDVSAIAAVDKIVQLVLVYVLYNCYRRASN